MEKQIFVFMAQLTLYDYLHFPDSDMTLFFLWLKKNSIACIYHTSLIHFSFVGHLGLVYDLPTVNSTALSTNVEVSL